MQCNSIEKKIIKQQKERRLDSSFSFLLSDQGSLCGNLIPENLTSVSNEMLVVFKSDSADTAKGFVLEYGPQCK